MSIERKCYLEECQGQYTDPSNPFCSDEHKDIWADRHYGKKGQKTGSHTKEFMQKRLKEMAEEARNKKLSL